MNSTNGSYSRMFDLTIIARTPNGVRTPTPCPFALPSPADLNGLPFIASGTNTGNRHDRETPRYATPGTNTGSRSGRETARLGLKGSVAQGRSEATPWDDASGCHARNEHRETRPETHTKRVPRIRPVPQQRFRQRPSRTPSGVRAKLRKTLMSYFHGNQQDANCPLQILVKILNISVL